ncbi:MAG: YbaK/EbsC family protein [Oscillospiraceae bacterium]|nr:YbaK/EbsC family protein [Oscillospiraceae bacterium]
MTIEKVKQLLAERGLSDRLHEFEASTATVELAAECLGVDPDQIAKTLSFYYGDGAVLVVAAGTRRIDNHKFKTQFGCKARMLSREDTERITGNAAGGVCPFLAPEGVQVWLDVSLRDHETVYPAAGSAHSGVALSCQELEELSDPTGWCDVCKPLEGAAQL